MAYIVKNESSDMISRHFGRYLTIWPHLVPLSLFLFIHSCHTVLPSVSRRSQTRSHLRTFAQAVPLHTMLCPHMFLWLTFCLDFNSNATFSERLPQLPCLNVFLLHNYSSQSGAYVGFVRAFTIIWHYCVYLFIHHLPSAPSLEWSWRLRRVHFFAVVSRVNL